MMYKKYLFLLFVPFMILLASCQQERQDADDMDKSHKEAVYKIFRIFDGGNVDELDDVIAENSVDHQMDTSMTKETGLAGVKELFRHMHRVFPDMKTTIHSIAESNDTVFVHSTSVGTTSEPFMGMPVNHQHTISGVDIIRFEGDKAAEHWGFIDMAAMRSMMHHGAMMDTSMNVNKP